MSPLNMIIYTAGVLKGTAYEPFVNFLLFCIFIVLIFATSRKLLGKQTISQACRLISFIGKSINKSATFAPEAETFRARIAPYIDVVVFSYMALVGAYSGIFVGIAYIFGSKNVPWFSHLIALVWILGSFTYMRSCLAQVSWAYHNIKSRS